MMYFRDRKDAGKQLAKLLLEFKNSPDCVVIGLPRGGVVTAFEVSQALNLPLDVLCPRKVGAPYNPELAVGAVCASGTGFFNEDVMRSVGVTREYLAQEIERQKKISKERETLFRKGKPPLNMNEKTVILVDDGLATGATMKAAIQEVKKQKAKKIIVAVPVSPPDTVKEIEEMVDKVYCLSAPLFFAAVGQFYENFAQTEDAEVIELLSKKKPSSA